ncbi:hypothetical protein DFH08DRAFT_928814 [Mycena albidolilacea]|uniref:Uncharacterized protein n=1 Tax=Mycena albidolilacea TaxID=1033008 RepID=A0AAD7AVF9_9AGAR|nr:hypothetical protein DFH08DRAFT_928814 [Mycena albidolilacea]
MSTLGFGALQFSPLDSSFASENLSSLVSSGAPYTASMVYVLTTLPTARPKNQSLARSYFCKRTFRGVTSGLSYFSIPEYTTRTITSPSSWTVSATAANDVTVEDTERLLERIEFIHLRHDLPGDIPLDSKEYKPRYFRFDDDSFIHEPACFDPLEGSDTCTPITRMWSLLNEYAHAHPDVESRMLSNHWPWQPKWQSLDYDKDARFPSFGGNFEIVKLARFRTPEMTVFLGSLASDPERFYKFRWGDAPLRKAMVYMFLNVAEVHQMCEVVYGHKTKTVSGMCKCTPLQLSPTIGAVDE